MEMSNGNKKFGMVCEPDPKDPRKLLCELTDDLPKQQIERPPDRDRVASPPETPASKSTKQPELWTREGVTIAVRQVLIRGKTVYVPVDLPKAPQEGIQLRSYSTKEMSKPTSDQPTTSASELCADGSCMVDDDSHENRRRVGRKK